MQSALKFLIIAVIGYLLGSFSFGLFVSHLNHGPNLRKVGSGNTGATNVTRVMGLSSGIATFLGDALKGVLASLIGLWLAGLHGAMLGGIAAIIGHDWPVFYNFKGGKGAATTCGVLLVCFPVPSLITFVIASIVIAITRFISLGSMLMVTLAMILISALNWGNWLIMLWTLVIALILFIRHRENIKRLLDGKESKFTGKKQITEEKK